MIDIFDEGSFAEQWKNTFPHNGDIFGKVFGDFCEWSYDSLSVFFAYFS